MIQHINENLLEFGGTDAICHQSNCYQTFGSGIALQIKKKYPEAYEADCKTVSGDPRKLGTFSVALAADGMHIYNCYSQFRYGLDRRHTNYEAIFTGLTSILKDLELRGIDSIALPKNMGCALGGGDWRIVERIIEVVFDKWGGTVFICNYTPKK